MQNKFISFITGWIFSKASFLVPLKKIASNEVWLAYAHPRPVYRRHYVFVPKMPYADLYACPFDDPAFTAAFFELVKEVIVDQSLATQECRLVFNGGAFQTFPLAHAHLISE